jgi:hypothetical protein
MPAYGRQLMASEEMLFLIPAGYSTEPAVIMIEIPAWRRA